MTPQTYSEKKSKMPAAKKKIDAPLAVVGTVAIDAVETPFGKREKIFGGSASYFSYAASFFVPVALAAVVGRDFPEEYRKILAERPIDLSHLEVRDGKTFCWKGKYGADLNSAQTLETHLNVLTEFDPKLKFENFPPFLFLANVDPVIQFRTLDQASHAKLRFTACDTMNYWIENKRKDLEKVIARVDCLVLNDGEARLLTGETNLIRAAQKVKAMGPGHVVIKKGEHGVLLYSGAQFFVLPAYPLESVFDPTGAGDTFAGAFMGYLASTGDVSFKNMKSAVAYGSVMASFTVENFGLESLRRLRRPDLNTRLQLFKRISSF